MKGLARQTVFSYRFFAPLFLSFIFLALGGCVTTGESYYETHFAERPDVQEFIQRVCIVDNFNHQYLVYEFNQVRVRPAVVSSTKSAKEHTVPWYTYRAIFISPERAQEGAEFWAAHQQTFALAQQKYGVSPQIITAILGVETRYGKVLGKYRVMDSLSTLAFNYPRRGPYFQSELEQYLILTRDLHCDPLSLYGSYAGAMGLPQFMPSSYRELAISASPPATPDLWYHPDDAILSVANYFSRDGWQPNQPIAVQAHAVNNKYLQLDISGLHTKYTVGELAQYGIKPNVYISPATPVNLLVLQGENGTEYWLAFHNFYVITRYNTSDFYAMAVYQLSQAILDAYHQQGSSY